jgi:mitogen-activated protein kinase 1/3
VLRPNSAERFGDLWIVLECCDWDLRKVMNTRMKAWSIEHVKRLLHQTLCGLAYLHGANIVHRDLKPANILVTSSCDIRICDFGLSREIRPLIPRVSSNMEIDGEDDSKQVTFEQVQVGGPGSGGR